MNNMIGKRNPKTRFSESSIDQFFCNDRGFITIFTVLMMLLILSIIGAASLNGSIMEAFTVRNNNLYTRNFYFAESAASEAVQWLENSSLTLEDPTGSFGWFAPRSTDMSIRTNWFGREDEWNSNSKRPESFYTAEPASGSTNLNILLPGSYTNDAVRFAVSFEGVSGGSTLKTTDPAGRLYKFNVFGMYSDIDEGLGEVHLELGYKKRF